MRTRIAVFMSAVTIACGTAGAASADADAAKKPPHWFPPQPTQTTQ